jgi:hypothetical protein
LTSAPDEVQWLASRPGRFTSRERTPGTYWINILLEFGMPKKLLRLIKMCLNETFNKVRIGKLLSDKFPIQNLLK